jgi:catechol 2,3-dioxygenase
MAKSIDPRVEIGHVHLKVADLDRALSFYNGVLGFEITQKVGTTAAFLSAGGYHHHIGLNTWESRGGGTPAGGTTGLYHFAIRYPDRLALGQALRRLDSAGVALSGASDHGVSEALYLSDPDGNGVELYWDRPRAEWPRAADGSIDMGTRRLDLDALRAAAVPSPEAAPVDPQYALMDDSMRSRLKDLRGRLLNLHKVLLDDTRTTYELDRGRVPSSSSLLQLVINDPWFAWLHSLSELIVRIDQAVEHEAPATRADAVALVDSVERLLTASETGDGFPRRYFEALQRQPAVVVAHSQVRRAIKEMK